MSSKTIKITGWVLTAILAFLFTLSAFIKLTLGETGLEQAAGLGVEPGTLQIIGVVELISLVLFLLPRTGVVGALLLIAYMGGAIATHVTLGQPLALVIVLETLIWIAAAFRFPEVRQRLFTGVN